jgi:hypothetical protein
MRNLQGGLARPFLTPAPGLVREAHVGVRPVTNEQDPIYRNPVLIRPHELV